jgi:hypothetical protein
MRSAPLRLWFKIYKSGHYLCEAVSAVERLDVDVPGPMRDVCLLPLSSGVEVIPDIQIISVL